MVSFVWFQCELFFWCQSLFLNVYQYNPPYLKSLNFCLEHNLRDVGTIDTVGLDGDDEIATLLQEVTSIDAYYTRLIGLSYVSEDGIDHTHLELLLLCISTNDLYSRGFLASMMRGTTLVRFLARLTKSRPDLFENSTA